MTHSTVVFASWDAEEVGTSLSGHRYIIPLVTYTCLQYGLVGSTEWGEDFGSWISDHVVSYLNVDVSVSGSQFHVAGSPSLAHVIKQTALDVPHPTDADRTLWDAFDDEGPYKEFVHNGTIDADYLELYTQKENRLRASETRVSPLGSGSDFTVFLQHLGVASSDQSFSQTLTDAPYHYHSIYDTHAWQERYADPGFHRHVRLCQGEFSASSLTNFSRLLLPNILVFWV